MRSAIHIRLAIMVCILFSTSCEKNTTDRVNQNNSKKSFSDYLLDSKLITLKGTVLDSYQKPINKVNISIGDKSVITDSLGQFIIKNVSSNANFSALSAEKEDYKKGNKERSREENERK